MAEGGAEPFFRPRPSLRPLLGGGGRRRIDRSAPDSPPDDLSILPGLGRVGVHGSTGRDGVVRFRRTSPSVAPEFIPGLGGSAVSPQTNQCPRRYEESNEPTPHVHPARSAQSDPSIRQGPPRNKLTRLWGAKPVETGWVPPGLSNSLQSNPNLRPLRFAEPSGAEGARFERPAPPPHPAVREAQPDAESIPFRTPHPPAVLPNRSGEA